MPSNNNFFECSTSEGITLLKSENNLKKIYSLTEVFLVKKFSFILF